MLETNTEKDGSSELLPCIGRMRQFGFVDSDPQGAVRLQLICHYTRDNRDMHKLNKKSRNLFIISTNMAAE